jgi:excisionase family DNA binding protein
MKITYDKKADALALIVSKGRVSRDKEIAKNVFAGFDRKGTLIEIQFLEVSQQEKPWLTLEAAAQILGKSTRTLLRWIDDGKLSPKKVGREYRISPEALKKFG